MIAHQWHPTQDEWSFFLEGNARVTLFASSGQARTFNYQPGDIGMSLVFGMGRSSRFSHICRLRPRLLRTLRREHK